MTLLALHACRRPVNAPQLEPGCAFGGFRLASIKTAETINNAEHCMFIYTGQLHQLILQASPSQRQWLSVLTPCWLLALGFPSCLSWQHGDLVMEAIGAEKDSYIRTVCVQTMSRLLFAFLKKRAARDSHLKTGSHIPMWEML